MLELIKSRIAHRLGLITQDEFTTLLERELKKLRGHAETTLNVQVKERLRLFAENKALRDYIADVEGYLKRTDPTGPYSQGDF